MRVLDEVGGGGGWWGRRKRVMQWEYGIGVFGRSSMELVLGRVRWRNAGDVEIQPAGAADPISWRVKVSLL